MTYDLDTIVSEIQSEAARLHRFKNGEEDMYIALRAINKKRLRELATRYIGDEQGPVNSLRFQILELLVNSKQKINANVVEELKERINSSTKADSFKAWKNDFSVLYPLLIKEFSFDIKDVFIDLANDFIPYAGLQKIVAKPHAVDFNGSRNFGSDHVWLAIYNKSHESQETAIQLFVMIDKDGMKCHVYNRFKDEYLSTITVTGFRNVRSQVFDFFNDQKGFIINDEAGKKEKEYRKIGVKDLNIYKISHGTEFFPTQKEIQHCIDNHIVVVHQDTKAKGQKAESQFDTFKNAKKGDLFYLCWGNSRCLLIGQFIDEDVGEYTYEGKIGWKQREYKFLYQSTSAKPYKGSAKWWAPNSSSTCILIPKEDIELANELLFQEHFQSTITSELTTELESPSPNIGISTNQVITINEDLDAKLEVKIVVKELTGIIDNLKKNKGQMLGIFGSWGRGKTFLYEQLKDYITTNKENKFKKYKHHIFNAWKYQETEAIWAHLYGSLLDKYLEEEGGNYFARQWKIFWLNIKRKGAWSFIKIMGSFLLSLVLVFFSTKLVIDANPSWVTGTNLEKNTNWVIAIVTGLFGLGGSDIVYKLYKKHYKSIKEVVLNYTSTYNYGEILGLQAEIQNELIVLMKHWLETKERLLLFVDDLDRCSEKKIIQVIDALRVMLDDEELIERVIILVAVDEILLERAIEHKYKEFNLDKNSPKEVVKEYMDKLFIGGVKLPKLTEFEQGVILKAYAINNRILEREVLDSSLEDTEGDTNTIIDNIDPNVEIRFPEKDDERVVVPSEFFLLEKELELLKANSDALSKNVTPRQLRIYIYRYLLAKNIASNYLDKKGVNNQLSDSYCEFLAKAIAVKSNKAKKEGVVQEEFSEEVIENEYLQIFTPKLLEIVVPY